MLKCHNQERKIYKITLSAYPHTLPGLVLESKVADATGMWEKQRAALKRQDWSETPLFKHFKKCPGNDFHSYLQQQYEGIYTDIELDYHERLCRVDEKSCSPADKEKLVLAHYNKTLHTLRVLMRLLGLDFHFTRIEAKYQSFYTMENLLLLITRCRKMYQAL